MRRLDDVDVCFLAWREAPRMLARHHEAVARAVGPEWRGRAVLAENAPPDATSRAARELVATSYPHATRLALRMPGNMGYGRAMNVALDACRGRYAALLNSDGRPEADMLVKLAEALDTHPEALWAAPAVHGPGEANEPPGPPYPEEQMAGTALLIRREAFLALGGFDPLYWFYNEDYDGSIRVREAGGVLLRVPDARFHHGKGGRSRRGRLIREWWYAVTDQTLVWHREPSRLRAARRLARGRRRSFAEHGAERAWPPLVAIAAATAALPVTSVLAERRRRRPWDARALDAWLERIRPRVERTPLDQLARPTGQLTPVPPSPQ